MKMTKLTQTTHSASGFAMPICGPDFGAIAPAGVLVRERAAGATGAVKGAAGLVQSYFPGTSAWRPPSC
jgi:hypothetical protein